MTHFVFASPLDESHAAEAVAEPVIMHGGEHGSNTVRGLHDGSVHGSIIARDESL
jgi:hypothetical protein